MLTARDWFGDGSIYVVDIPLACCALETQAAAGLRPPVALSELPLGADLVVTLSGTITAAIAPAVSSTLQTLPSERTVVAFGACACAGGPYWDAYSVLPGADDLVPVDHYIAGCPPPPAALDNYLEQRRDTLLRARP